MPRRWSGQKPNKSLKEKGITNHLQELGIDTRLFKKFVEAGINPGSVRKFFKKPDGSMYTVATVSKWIRLFKEEQA